MTEAGIAPKLAGSELATEAAVQTGSSLSGTRNDEVADSTDHGLHTHAAARAAWTDAGAQTSVAEFYRCGQIRLVSANGPGSGYTLWARLIAQHLGKHLPGQPAVIVESMGGAGGMIAANWAYSVAPRDGKTILSVVRETAVLSVLHAKGVQFDAQKFAWLGSPTNETSVCVARVDAPWRTVDDAYTKEMLVGTDGVGSGLHIFPVALNSILGMKFKVIDGYSDSGAVLLAADRGEVDGSCQSAETMLHARGAQIASGAIRVILQAGLKRNPQFPDAPFVMDLARTPAQKQSLQFLYASMAFGRPFLAPPAVPADRVAALQDAFMQTFADPDFLAEAKKQGYTIDPVSGPQMKKLLDDVVATPPDVVKEVARLIDPQGGR